MKVRDIMRREVRHISPQTDLATAGRIMAEIDGGILPVVDSDGEVLGVVTDRDVCLALAQRDVTPSSLRAGALLDGRLYDCRMHDELSAALQAMATHRVRRLVVTDETNRLVGLLSLDDVVLQAHPFASDAADGPVYAEVASTLQAICSHPTPALRV